MRSGTPKSYKPIASPDSVSPQLRTGQSFIERMGVLYADRIRLDIVSELHMREMSPTQFFEQVGGRSYSSVRRHFVRLADSGWLRMVRKRRTARGRPEHLYRSTELAVIDDETWAQIPPSIQDAFTVQNLVEMGERLAESLSDGSFAARDDNLLDFRSFALDNTGWAQAITAVNQCFRSLSQEQTDAKVRMERSGAAPIRMVVELGGFALAPPNGTRTHTALPTAPPASGAPPWPRCISLVFRDPLDLMIIQRLNDRAQSPTELVRNLGGDDVIGFDRRCKRLVRLGWVVKVHELTGGPRRGSTENFYRATSPAPLQEEVFSDLSKQVTATESWGTFSEFCQSAMDAVRAGTFNERPDRHMTLCKMLVDEIGWHQVIQMLEKCLRLLIQIGEAAPYRSSRDGTNGGQRVGFFVAGFAGSAHPRS